MKRIKRIFFASIYSLASTSMVACKTSEDAELPVDLRNFATTLKNRLGTEVSYGSLDWYKFRKEALSDGYFKAFHSIKNLPSLINIPSTLELVDNVPDDSALPRNPKAGGLYKFKIRHPETNKETTFSLIFNFNNTKTKLTQDFIVKFERFYFGSSPDSSYTIQDPTSWTNFSSTVQNPDITTDQMLVAFKTLINTTEALNNPYDVVKLSLTSNGATITNNWLNSPGSVKTYTVLLKASWADSREEFEYHYSQTLTFRYISSLIL